MENIYKKWTLADMLILLNTKGIGNQAFRTILEKTDSFYTFSKSSDIVLKRIFAKIGGTQLFESNLNSYIEQQLHAFDKFDMNLVGFWSDDYPHNLSNDNYCPPLLFVKGDISFVNDKRCISIVGTRRNSSYGKAVTEKFTEAFVANDIAIISGMAQGIDSIAHEIAMKKEGKTLAVLASGLDQIQPSYARDFAKRIVDSGGAVMTAYSPMTKALNQFFVQRNRIVSGLSAATLVVESKAKGGSLWTAKFANEQNREVFAVPGKIYSEKSDGTHELIRSQIAHIAISPEQILNELGYSSVTETKRKEEPKNLSTNERTILSILEADPINLDTILDTVNNSIPMNIAELQSHLLIMEFNGLVKQVASNSYYKL